MSNNQRTYASKMDEAMSKAMADWWLGLSKDEILDYLREQPTVTADDIREMVKGLNSTLAFDIRFSSTSNEAVTDFHIEETEE